MVVQHWENSIIPGRNPPLCCTLPSIGMQGHQTKTKQNILSVCVFSAHSIWTSSSLDVPAGVTQEEGRTGVFIHLLSAVRALIFLARRIRPFLSLVDHEVEFCVLTIYVGISRVGDFCILRSHLCFYRYGSSLSVYSALRRILAAVSQRNI